MGDLPLIPGYSFRDYTVQDHKIKHKLNYSNGCRTICDSNIGLGRRPIDSASSAYAQEIPEEVLYDPSLTYGRKKTYPYRQVIPHYVLYAQKCLKFNAFFRESVFNSPIEYHRVRHVNIIYFLEDDTMSVVEPPVNNAGLYQGKLVRRAKIPKNQGENFYHWKDLNVGIDLAIYGIVYHTVDCDVFTKEFLRSQGIDVGDKEQSPPDSYTQNRIAKEAAVQSTPPNKLRSSSHDSRRRFLEYTGMILTFEAIWNDDFYQVIYFLTDDTILVKEIPKMNNGKDPHRVLLKRMKVPKNWLNMPNTFPSIYFECSDNEIVEYYTPADLKVGETIFIYGRGFLLYDCDSFTRKYYSKMLNIEQLPRMSVNTETSLQPGVHKQNLPRKSFEKIDIKNKKHVIRGILNHPNKLRYLASMVAVHPEDEGRDFVLEYNLSDGKVKINEITKRNSGHRAGCFLAFMHVPKPNEESNNDVGNHADEEDGIIYYSPEDFFIGAHINVFNHRFIIKGADLFVLKYVQGNPDKFPSEIIENITNYFANKNMIDERVINECNESSKITKEPLLPVKQPTDSSRDTKTAESNLSHNISSCDKRVKDEYVLPPRKITWADQVHVPCIL